MDDRFKNIDDEKRDRILNSAFEEFAINKYSKASTNNIVKNANISRGLLYHYFTNKIDLYNYLKNYSINLVEEEVSEKIDWEITDIFERIKQIIMIKMAIFERYPFLVEFFMMMMSNDEPKIDSKEEIKNLQEDYKDSKVYRDIYTENIDYTKFKDDMDVKKALDIIRWTIEKYGEEMQTKIKMSSGKTLDYVEMALEIDEYNEILKTAFYK